MTPPRHSEDLSAAQLFREHGAFVARILYRLGVPPQAIEDAVQDVFLVVHQRGGYRPGPAKPTTYLALIASRAASAQRRQQRLRSARQGSTQPEEIHAQDDDPALHFERRDDLCRLQDALSRLDPTLRDTLVLAEFQDETAPAIADAMGVSVGTVYWRLHEARKKFQRALASADSSRTRAASERLPSARRTGRALARGAKLAALLGLLRWSEARALFEAARGADYAFDLDGALARHLERGAEVPPATAALRAPNLGARAGALKIGAWAGAAAIGTLAALRALYGAPAATEEPRAGVMERAQASSPAAGADAVPASVAPPEVETDVAETHSARDAARARLPAAASHANRALRGDRDSASAPASPDARAAVSAAAPPRREPAATREEPARAAPPEKPAPAERAAPGAHDPMLEARALARAHQLLAAQPARALAIVDGLPNTSAYLSEERAYIRVLALYAVARRAEADRAAERFLLRYPSSVFRERVSAARKAAAALP